MSGFNHTNLQQSLLPPIKPHSIVWWALCIGVALGTGAGHGFQQVIPYSQSGNPTMTSAAYERIHPDMTLTQVRAILGAGTEVRKSASGTVVEWDIPKGPKISATFQDDRLIEKTQEWDR